MAKLNDTTGGGGSGLTEDDLKKDDDKDPTQNLQDQQGSQTSGGGSTADTSAPIQDAVDDAFADLDGSDGAGTESTSTRTGTATPEQTPSGGGSTDTDTSTNDPTKNLRDQQDSPTSGGSSGGGSSSTGGGSTPTGLEDVVDQTPSHTGRETQTGRGPPEPRPDPAPETGSSDPGGGSPGGQGSSSSPPRDRTPGVVTEAEQQNVDAAFADVNEDVRDAQQGLETGDMVTDRTPGRITEREQQRVNAAVADVNDRVARQQQGIEQSGAGSDEVAAAALEFEERVVEQSDLVDDPSEVRIIRDGDTLRAELTPTGAESQMVEGPSVGEQARSLEQRVIDANPGITDPDQVRVVRDGDTLQVELTAQGAEAVGQNPTRREVAQQVAADNPDVLASDLAVETSPFTIQEDSEGNLTGGPGFEVSLTDEARADRQRTGDEAAEAALGSMFVTTRTEPGAGDRLAERNLENMFATTRFQTAPSGGAVAPADRAETNEEGFLNDVLGGAPDDAQAAERDLFSGARSTYEDVAGEADTAVSGGVAAATGAAQAGVNLGQRRVRGSDTLQAVASSSTAREIGRQVSIAEDELANPLTPRGERVVEQAGDTADEFSGGSGSRAVGGGLAGAAAAGVVAPEPVSSGAGLVTLGGIAVAGAAGAALAGEANDRLSEDDLVGTSNDGRTTRVGTGEGTTGSELSVPENGSPVVSSELDATTGDVFASEVSVTTGGQFPTEIDTPSDPTVGTGGEIGIPSLATSQFAQQQRSVQRQERQRQRDQNRFREGGSDLNERREILRGPEEEVTLGEEVVRNTGRDFENVQRETFVEERLSRLREESTPTQSATQRLEDAQATEVQTGAGPQPTSPIAGAAERVQSATQTSVSADTGLQAGQQVGQTLAEAQAQQQSLAQQQAAVQTPTTAQAQAQLQAQGQQLQTATPNAFGNPTVTTPGFAEPPGFTGGPPNETPPSQRPTRGLGGDPPDPQPVVQSRDPFGFGVTNPIASGFDVLGAGTTATTAADEERAEEFRAGFGGATSTGSQPETDAFGFTFDESAGTTGFDFDAEAGGFDATGFEGSDPFAGFDEDDDQGFGGVL